MHRFVFGAVLVLAGCNGGPTIPAAPEVEVQIIRVATPQGSRLRVTLLNHGEARVYLNACGGMWLEVQRSEGWMRASGDACIPGPHPPVEVEPDHSYTREFSVVTDPAVSGVAHVALMGASSGHLAISESINTTP